MVRVTVRIRLSLRIGLGSGLRSLDLVLAFGFTFRFGVMVMGYGFGYAFRLGFVLAFWFGLGLGPEWWLGAHPYVVPVLTFLLLGPLSCWILSASSFINYECPQEQGGRSESQEGLPRSRAPDSMSK